MKSVLKSGFVVGGSLEKVIHPDLLKTEPPQISVPSIHERGSDLYWMREALLESLNSVGITNPNPAVGCVIVKNGQEIARGHTQAYRGKHAERFALEKIGDPRVLEGATAYVTLEPCAHQGHQPPCCDLLADYPLARVVVGRLDSDPRVNGKGIERLRASGKIVDFGFYENEITAWNLPFFATRARPRPFVALKWAQTLDGQLADDSGTSQWISGPHSRSYTHWLRQRYDAILVGAKTFLADQPRLNVRDCAHPIQHQPMKIVWDPKGEIPKSESITVISEQDVNGVMETLQSKEMERKLGRPFQSILIEGGPGVLSRFVKADLADVMHVFISPKITGGERYRIQTYHLLKSAREFQLLSQARLGSDTLIEMISPELAAAL